MPTRRTPTHTRDLTGAANHRRPAFRYSPTTACRRRAEFVSSAAVTLGDRGTASCRSQGQVSAHHARQVTAQPPAPLRPSASTGRPTRSDLGLRSPAAAAKTERRRRPRRWRRRPGHWLRGSVGRCRAGEGEGRMQGGAHLTLRGSCQRATRLGDAWVSRDRPCRGLWERVGGGIFAGWWQLAPGWGAQQVGHWPQVGH